MEDEIQFPHESVGAILGRGGMFQRQLVVKCDDKLNKFNADASSGDLTSKPETGFENVLTISQLRYQFRLGLSRRFRLVRMDDMRGK